MWTTAGMAFSATWMMAVLRSTAGRDFSAVLTAMGASADVQAAMPPIQTALTSKAAAKIRPVAVMDFLILLPPYFHSLMACRAGT
jgi:hypothetical protein